MFIRVSGLTIIQESKPFRADAVLVFERTRGRGRERGIYSCATTLEFVTGVLLRKFLQHLSPRTGLEGVSLQHSWRRCSYKLRSWSKNNKIMTRYWSEEGRGCTTSHLTIISPSTITLKYIINLMIISSILYIQIRDFDAK